MNAWHPLRLVRRLMLLINNDQPHFVAQRTDRRSGTDNKVRSRQCESRVRIEPLALARSSVDQFGVNPGCSQECISGYRNLCCLWDEPEHRSSCAQCARHDLCRNTTLARPWWPIKQRHAHAKVRSEERLLSPTPRRRTRLVLSVARPPICMAPLTAAQLNVHKAEYFKSPHGT